VDSVHTEVIKFMRTAYEAGHLREKPSADFVADIESFIQRTVSREVQAWIQNFNDAELQREPDGMNELREDQATERAKIMRR